MTERGCAESLSRWDFHTNTPMQNYSGCFGVAPSLVQNCCGKVVSGHQL